MSCMHCSVSGPSTGPLFHLYLKGEGACLKGTSQICIYMTYTPYERSSKRHPSLARAALLSESYVPVTMPAVLGTTDLTSLVLLNVFWITNVTPMIAVGGLAAFSYWILCGLLFFVPCTLMLAQLGRLFPHEGSFFLWTYHALGPGWDAFVGVCIWLPGVLSLMNAGGVIISCLQALNPFWLVPSWQQGAAILVVLLVAGILSVQRTRMVFQVLNVATGAMLLATILLMVVALVWLLRGHHAATNFAQLSGWALIVQGPQSNLGLLGNGVLAYFGSNMALTMAGEVSPWQQRTVLRRHLLWSTLLILVGYLALTFALLTVEGANIAATTSNPVILAIMTADTVFGKAAGDVVAVCVMFFFFAIVVALNVGYGRLLMVAGIEGRISVWFALLNKVRVPAHAMWTQIGIAAGLTVLLYVLVPLITLFGNPANFTSEAYNVISASVLLVWAIGYLFPFIDVAALYLRNRSVLSKQRIAPLPVLAFSVLSGSVLCVGAIVTTLTNSFIPQLMPNQTWGYVVGGLTLACLILCGIGSMLTHSQAQWEAMHAYDSAQTRTDTRETR
jgi:amino acid transporter